MSIVRVKIIIVSNILLTNLFSNFTYKVILFFNTYSLYAKLVVRVGCSQLKLKLYYPYYNYIISSIIFLIGIKTMKYKQIRK